MIYGEYGKKERRSQRRKKSFLQGELLFSFFFLFLSFTIYYYLIKAFNTVL